MTENQSGRASTEEELLQTDGTQGEGEFSQRVTLNESTHCTLEEIADALIQATLQDDTVQRKNGRSKMSRRKYTSVDCIQASIDMGTQVISS